MADNIKLKWGTLKGWDVESAAAMALLKQYHEIGASFGCAQQCDTQEQKKIICDLIDVADGKIYNSWSGEIMSKEDAKRYVLEYQR